MTRALPSGTVTFVFTDVEGSTKLLHELGAVAYGSALAAHRAVVRDACARHGGVEVDTQGDAFFFAFATAPDATRAAAELVAGLEDGPIAVRVGVHTGTPLLTDEGYVGHDVHRAARIAAAGHGRQVLVSGSTAALVGDELVDLGEHRFKDLGAPERVFQLGSGDFPPIRSLYRSNLPVPAAGFVGRERELADVARLICRDDVRLLTLTGPGGTGKTRLALHAAAEASDAFPDGVWWVTLASLRDPELVEGVVVQALGGHGSLARVVGDRRMLVLVDNFEHVIQAAPLLAGLLPACPGSTLLVTSREVLGVAGEHVFPVPELAGSEAVTLFSERSGLPASDTVAEVCRRLDGMPLAIELAAARARLLTPEQLLERLPQRLDLLRGGRDADPRQQTLRATIEWSYDLLTPAEQQLFARLAVFPGGYTVEAAEAICGADVDALQSLLDKSLLRRREGDTGSRLWMLETIRELALERLDAAGEADGLRRAHALHVLGDATSWGLSYDAIATGVEQRHDLALADLDNLRAALDWALAHDPARGLEAALACEQLWIAHAPDEGARRIEALLARAGDVPVELRARALRDLGAALEVSGETDAGTRLYEQCLCLFEELGDERCVLDLRFRLANHLTVGGDLATARQMYEQNLERARAAGMTLAEANATSGLAYAAATAGDLRAALDLERAARDLLRRAGGWAWGEVISAGNLAEYSIRLGLDEDAAGYGREALDGAWALGDRQSVLWMLALLAWVARACGDLERAGRLWGAMEAEEAHAPLWRWAEERPRYAAHVLVGGEPELERGLVAGRRLSLADAVGVALRSPAADPPAVD